MRVLSAILTIVLPSAIWAAGSTFTWKGTEGDGKWSTPGNWQVGGATATVAPGSSDTVIFDSTSGSGTSYVDAGLPDYSTTVPGATVYELQLKSDFTGSVVLQKKLNVWYKYTQDAGTFTCGDNDIRFGDLTTRSYGTPRCGNFYLNGGTFNAPSGEFQYYSVSHQVYCKKTGGTFNHNNGTFIIETSCGGGNLYFSFADETFNNFIIRRAPGNSAVTSINGYCTTNTVLGDMTIDAGNFPDSVSAKAMFDVKGDLTVSGVCAGGQALVRLSGEDDQYVHVLSDAKMPPLMIDKQMDKKVVFDGGHALTICTVSSATTRHGFELVSGQADMSALTSFGVDAYASAFNMADSCSVAFPPMVKLRGYWSGSSIRINNRTFNNLYIASTWGRLNIGTTTNTVLGDLTVGAGGFNGSSAVMNVKGNYHLTYCRQ